MKLNYIVTTTCMLFLFLFVVSVREVLADPSPLALLKGAEAARMKYESIQVQFTTAYVNDDDFATVTISSLVESDKVSRRFENFPAETPGTFPGEVSIFKNGEVYHYRRGKSNGVRYYDLAEAVRRADMVYDPRILGLTDLPSADKTVRQCMCYDVYSKVSLVGQEVMNGTKVWHVHCVCEGLATADFWIEEPSFRIHKHTVLAKRLNMIIDSKYDAKSVGPFPTEISFQRFEDGRQVFNRVTHITKVEFGKPIPADRYTLASMNLPVNTDVVDYRIHRIIGWWDGEKLVDQPVRMSVQEQRELEKKKNSPPLGNTVRYILMGTGLLMILIAIVSMVRKRWHKTR